MMSAMRGLTVLGCLVILLVYHVAATAIETIEPKDSCGALKTVSQYDYYELTLESGNFYGRSCIITFRSRDSSDLVYSFNEFDCDDRGFSLTVYSQSSRYDLSARRLGTYGRGRKPELHSDTTGEKYLKFVLRKGVLSLKCNVRVLISAEDDDHDHHGGRLYGWVVGCIVTAVITFLVVLAVAIFCACKKKAATRGRVVASSNGQVVTTTLGGVTHTQYVNSAFAGPPTYQQLFPGNLTAHAWYPPAEEEKKKSAPVFEHSEPPPAYSQIGEQRQRPADQPAVLDEIPNAVPHPTAPTGHEVEKY